MTCSSVPMRRWQSLEGLPSFGPSVGALPWWNWFGQPALACVMIRHEGLAGAGRDEANDGHPAQFGKNEENSRSTLVRMTSYIG
jgi:hypothetical protein